MIAMLSPSDWISVVFFDKQARPPTARDAMSCGWCRVGYLPTLYLPRCTSTLYLPRCTYHAVPTTLPLLCSGAECHEHLTPDAARDREECPVPRRVHHGRGRQGERGARGL